MPTRTWKYFGLDEKLLEHQVEGIERGPIRAHTEPVFPESHLIAHWGNEVSPARVVRFEEELAARVGQYLVGIDDETLPERVVKRLIERGWIVTTAESCTGGQISHAITSVSGSSACFNEGFVTYSNRSKELRLGVNRETLLRFGAVSRQTAQEMATGVRTETRADVALSVTGIAGPTGGTPDKPVGTVFIGLATPAATTVHELALNDHQRHEIRTLSTWSALALLLFVLEDRLPPMIVRRV